MEGENIFMNSLTGRIKDEDGNVLYKNVSRPTTLSVLQDIRGELKRIADALEGGS